MVTNRTPTKPSAALRITPLALTFFRRMEELDCSCADVGADGLRPGGQCPGCQQWWNLHSRLHDLLKLKPWHWPVYEHPDAGNPILPALWRMRAAGRTRQPSNATVHSPVRSPSRTPADAGPRRSSSGPSIHLRYGSVATPTCKVAALRGTRVGGSSAHCGGAALAQVPPPSAQRPGGLSHHPRSGSLFWRHTRASDVLRVARCAHEH